MYIVKSGKYRGKLVTENFFNIYIGRCENYSYRVLFDCDPMYGKTIDEKQPTDVTTFADVINYANEKFNPIWME